MDCSICSPVWPPTNSICQACYNGAKGIIDFLNKLEHNREIIDKPSCSDPSTSNSSKFQGISDALKWVKDMKEREEWLNEKLSFLSGSVKAFKDGIRADLQVKPGKGSSIFAHRIVLAQSSGIFKNMLETISLPELNHEELESLLEFLYSGSLPIDKLDKNKYSLLVAAHKYEIPFLQKNCENQILESIDSSNVDDVLKILKVCSNTKLKEAAVDFIIKHMENIEITTPLPKKKKRHSSGRSKNSDSKGKSIAEVNATTEDTQSECPNRGMSKTKGKNKSGSRSNSGSRSGRSRSNSGSRSSSRSRSRSNSGSRSGRSRSGRNRSNSGSRSRSGRSRSNSGSRSKSGSSRSKSGSSRGKSRDSKGRSKSGSSRGKSRDSSRDSKGRSKRRIRSRK